MADKPPPAKPQLADSKSKPTAAKKTPYVSGGQMLDSPPLTARALRLLDDTYNALGLYVVSLFSMDPYAAAQNSQFNTAGPGRVSNAARAQWNNNNNSNSNNNSSGGGPRGGGGGGPGGAGGRRLGTVDDVRGPECGSCG